ncbi:MAG: hypothetical protein A2Z88_05810 [Omnitrophica WOR_2 bacterium GWA2_47_8]|nr:MAG: hypothetical protein A2Z88_05810 [Omnitrophica WOR_2 bacterium GWA2_47_8]
MNAKLKQLVSQFPKSNIDALLVTHDVNIRYLTDFPASESWLLVTPKKAVYITDFRYVLEAQKGLKGISVECYTKSFFDTVSDLSNRLRIKHLGFDERHLSLAAYLRLKQAAGSAAKLKATNNLVENLRIIKTKEELSLTRQAIKITLEAYAFIGKRVKPGLTEQQILADLENFVKAKKVGFSFSPIVAGGPNSCFPHAKVTERKLKNNEPLLIDMGIDVKGYKSDLTRMFFLGKIPPLVKKVNECVKEAQQRAIDKVKPGRLASFIDAQARNYLESKDLGKYFGHSLGHGVGLEIHEAPTISQKSNAVLKENMIFTVEPAVYIPNQFGIRIEDMVLVTERGCEILTR